MAVEDADETVSLRRMDRRGGCVESGWTDHYSLILGRHSHAISLHQMAHAIFIEKMAPSGLPKWRGWSENGVCKDPP